MDFCGPLNSYTFGLCPHPLNFLSEYLSIVRGSLKAETTALHFINDKNDGGDHNITANEDSDGVNGGNEDVNNNSIDGNCGNEGDGKDDNLCNGDRGEDNGTRGNDNGVNALGMVIEVAMMIKAMMMVEMRMIMLDIEMEMVARKRIGW